MSMTIACPSCGTKRRLDANSMGLKIQCDCGISFSVSPVFAVPDRDESTMTWLTGKSSRLTRWLASCLQLPGSGGGMTTVFAVFILLAGSAALAAWLMSWGGAATLDPRGKATDPAKLGYTGLAPRASNSGSSVPKPSTGQNSVPLPSSTEMDPTPPDPKPTPTPPPPPPTPIESLRASKLWDAFDIDRDAAAEKYFGQVVEVTGSGKVHRDEEGHLYFGAQMVTPGTKPVSKQTAQEKRWEKSGYPPNLRCYLQPGEAAALADADPKKEYVFRGVCTGRREDPHVYMGYIVILERCQQIKP
jgi:hypothetical protein